MANAKLGRIITTFPNDNISLNFAGVLSHSFDLHGPSVHTKSARDLILKPAYSFSTYFDNFAFDLLDTLRELTKRPTK